MPDPTFPHMTFDADQSEWAEPVAGASAFGEPSEAIRQSAAMAVQDAVAYLRQTYTIANAALALAETRLVQGEDAAGAQEAITAGQAAVGAAVDNLVKVSNSAELLLRRAPAGLEEAISFAGVTDAELDIQADR